MDGETKQFPVLWFETATHVNNKILYCEFLRCTLVPNISADLRHIHGVANAKKSQTAD